MPKYLTSEQVTRFDDDGVIFPIEVMSPAEAEALRRRLEAAEAAHPEALGPFNRNNAHLTFTVLDEIAHHPRICDAVEDLIGENFLAWGTVLFIKEPHDPGFVSWHQDATYMGLEPHIGVSAWLALSPSTVESGCMRMIPGTHKGGIRPHSDTFEEENILTRGQTIRDLEEDRAVDLVLRPGEMSLHHPRVIHSSQPNRSAARRIGVVTQAYFPPQVRQTLGPGYAQLVRGSDPFGHMVHLPRPSADMAPEDVSRRERVNLAWSDYLYRGAEKKRAY